MRRTHTHTHTHTHAGAPSVAAFHLRRSGALPQNAKVLAERPVELLERFNVYSFRNLFGIQSAIFHALFAIHQLAAGRNGHAGRGL